MRHGFIRDFHFGFPSTVEQIPISIQSSPRVALFCTKARFPREASLSDPPKYIKVSKLKAFSHFHPHLPVKCAEWQNTIYPVAPGHEIVGRVVKTGHGAKKFKEGDLAAVGCMVDSCGTCPSCQRGLEQYCHQFPTFTYNGADKHLGGPTFGGYAESIVVDEAFTLKVADKVDPASTAPLLCAGITET